MKFKAKIFITCGHRKSQGIYSKSRVPAPASQSHFPGNKSFLGLFWETTCVRALQAASAPHYGITDTAGRERNLSHPPTSLGMFCVGSMGLMNLMQLVKKGHFCADLHFVLIATKISSSAGRKGSPVFTSSLKKL